MTTSDEIAEHDDQRDLGESGWATLRKLYSELFAGRVLDAGGGSGIYTSQLVVAGLDVVLVDTDDGMLEAARNRGISPATIVRADVTALPFRDGAFAGAHVAHVLHVVPDWRAAVREIERVTKVGGTVMLALGGSGTVTTEQREISESVNLELGTDALTAGQAAGLDSTEAADDAFAAGGMEFAGTRRIDGAQRRTAEQLVHRMALNPFRSTADREMRDEAAFRIKRVGGHAKMVVTMTPSSIRKGQGVAVEPQTRGNKITSIVLGIFLVVSGVTIAVVSLTGVLPAGKSNSPITWIATIALVVLGTMWLILGLKAPLKR